MDLPFNGAIGRLARAKGAGRCDARAAFADRIAAPNHSVREAERLRRSRARESDPACAPDTRIAGDPRIWPHHDA